MDNDKVLAAIKRLEELVIAHQALSKKILSFKEACDYLSLSESHLYKLTSSRSIPHYCPQGKKLYFNRHELDDWLLRNRLSTEDELEDRVNDFNLKTGR